MPRRIELPCPLASMFRHWLWIALAPGIVLLTSPASAAGNPEAGKARAAVCGACHGVDGNSTNPEWPNLAGQGAAYMVTQLKRFKSGERENVLMAPQAVGLSEQDMLDVSAYYSAQAPKTGVARAKPKVLDLGELIYRGGILERNVPACITCHGPAGGGNGPAQFPRVAGQHAAYVALQLKSFREGFEAHKLHTRQNPMMNEVAAKLTDQEIEAVSHYISGLH